jgi:uncharacterized Zn-binding protein involved in type VI secretion
MSDNNAARKGDEIIHSSIFADITSIGGRCRLCGDRRGGGRSSNRSGAIAGGRAAAAGVAAIGSSCLLSGIIGGVLANVAGSPTISATPRKGLGNALFPPSPAGKITTGSNNVLTNAIPAARARAR